MKKILVVTSMLFLTIPGFCQFGKGRILLGGSGSFHYQKPLDTKTTGFSLVPNFGYFVADRVALGTGIGYTSIVSKFAGFNGDEVKVKSNNFSFSPFVRIYFEPGIFFSGAYGLAIGKGSSYNGVGVDSYKFDYGQLELAAGYAYFLNDHVAIEPKLGYTLAQPFSDGSSGALSLNIGFQIYLGEN